VSSVWAVNYIEAAKQAGLIGAAGPGPFLKSSDGDRAGTLDPAGQALLQKYLQQWATDGQGGSPSAGEPLGPLAQNPWFDVANTSKPGVTRIDRGTLLQALEALKNKKAP
jgi:hypothetical protein